MQNNQSDRFEQSKNSHFEKNKNANNFSDETNFFITNKTTIPTNFIKQEQSRRLNDYDSNLLQEDAYKDVDDDLFKLEYRIAKYEDELKLLNSQVQAARDINDFSLINELNLRKNSIKKDLELLITDYNKKSLSTKISGGISNFISSNTKNKFTQFKYNFERFFASILSKLPKPFSSAIELKNSLSKLENINRSVDDLVSSNAPFGENTDKYEQLSKYIIKANSIQSNISRQLK